mmetsp:Transcript_72508/g.193764  ORF Transcript_72508/g.193764 Transcript_72508/m.193764 type:complete len:126 (+) Transcript_72508:540-917(+)
MPGRSCRILPDLPSGIFTMTCRIPLNYCLYQDFLRGIRREFGADVPIVICLISGSEYRLPFKAAVRKAQISAPEFCTALNFVDTEDLEFQDDGLHLTSGSQHILGERLAECWMDLFKVGVGGVSA